MLDLLSLIRGEAGLKVVGEAILGRISRRIKLEVIVGGSLISIVSIVVSR